jgi:hypothetical protein
MWSKGAESNNKLRQRTLPRLWIEQHLTVCGKTKTPKKIPRIGKSQKWTSYPTDTRQNPRLKNHEVPKSEVWHKYLNMRLTACRCEVLGDAWKRAHRHTEN